MEWLPKARAPRGASACMHSREEEEKVIRLTNLISHGKLFEEHHCILVAIQDALHNPIKLWIHLFRREAKEEKGSVGVE